uniref:Uncharacterized protein n=1 Tax=Trypanosoma vivax (strain Y486) TaxID=1055687 RepID=G0U873_TRYVY|nr:hypothetical protein, unlikely [Trypanosoma vivax Y486]
MFRVTLYAHSHTCIYIRAYIPELLQRISALQPPATNSVSQPPGRKIGMMLVTGTYVLCLRAIASGSRWSNARLLTVNGWKKVDYHYGGSSGKIRSKISPDKHGNEKWIEASLPSLPSVFSMRG